MAHHLVGFDVAIVDEMENYLLTRDPRDMLPSLAVGLGRAPVMRDTGFADQITIVAFDASPAGKQAVFEKKLYDSPQQFPRNMAKGTVEAFVKHLEGEMVEKKIFISCSHYYYETSASDDSRVAEQW